MVAPRYDFKKCALTGNLTRVYAGGCVIEPAEFDKTAWWAMGECGCKPGECQAKDQDIEELLE